jgi:hypothetical protein
MFDLLPDSEKQSILGSLLDSFALWKGDIQLLFPQSTRGPGRWRKFRDDLLYPLLDDDKSTPREQWIHYPPDLVLPERPSFPLRPGAVVTPEIHSDVFERSTVAEQELDSAMSRTRSDNCHPYYCRGYKLDRPAALASRIAFLHCMRSNAALDGMILANPEYADQEVWGWKLTGSNPQSNVFFAVNPVEWEHEDEFDLLLNTGFRVENYITETARRQTRRN